MPLSCVLARTSVMHRVLLSLLLARSVLAGLWCEYFIYDRIEAHGVTRCGKQFRAGQPANPPWGQFPIPATTSSPQLSLRCQPALSPFLPDDVGDSSTSLIIVDALVRDEEIAGALPLPGSYSPISQLNVTVWINGVQEASGTVPLNGSTVIPFSLSGLSPSTEPYSLLCTATLPSPQGQNFTSFTSIPATLSYLPSPPGNIGSITKIDQRTGGLLVKQAGSQGPYESIFPVGFFSQFDGYLSGNENALQELQSQG
jgi:hypothetical protein